MQTVLLTLSRFCLSAWVGAAVLFVITGIQEARSPEFDTVTKSSLAVLRFPSYYAFGFSLVAASLLFAIVAGKHHATGVKRHRIAVGLMLAALLMMVIDYVWIYSPLSAMLSAKLEARPANFDAYHKGSMYINTVHLSLCIVAALLLCRPNSKTADS